MKIPISYYLFICASKKMNNNIHEDKIEDLIFDSDWEPDSDDDLDADPGYHYENLEHLTGKLKNAIL